MNDSPECFVEDSVELESPTEGGALSGLRFALKDLVSVAGHTSSFGHDSWLASHEASAENAPMVDLLLTAGANLVGIAKMDQLAYSLIGNAGSGSNPLNSFDSELYCGGSSSGSASAVAAGLADFGIGTDTAGSIRVPAAACGLASIRPSHSAIPPVGVLPLADSLDTVGIMASSMGVVGRVLRVLAPEFMAAPPRPISKLLVPVDILDGLSASDSRLFRETCEEVSERASLEIVDVMAADYVSADVGDLFARIQGREIWGNHGTWVADYGEDLLEDVRVRLQRCEALASDSLETIDADLRARVGYSGQFHTLLASGGVLALPVVPYRGPLLSASDEDLLAFRVASFRMTAPSSLVGGPQAVVQTPSKTAGWKPPFSLVGLPGDDVSILELLDRSEVPG